MKEIYTHRTCYVNFAEHLQNTWNVNLLYEDAPGIWTEAEWEAFFKELKAFGFTNFQFWIPPTLCKPGEQRNKAIRQLNMIIHKCHQAELTVNPFIAVNTIGAEWYFACPNDPEDRKRILEIWEFFADNLTEADIVLYFPEIPADVIEMAAIMLHSLSWLLSWHIC